MKMEWIHMYALNRKFNKDKEDKQYVLERYLVFFKSELERGNIRQKVDRYEVLDVPTYNEEVWIREKYHWLFSSNASSIESQAVTNNDIDPTKMISK